MPSAAPEPGELPSPAAALEAAFESIRRVQMQDMPMLNPALRVEAVGFRQWQQHWLGVLVTPWFMNLVLMPRLPSAWHPVAEGVSRHHRFPAGVFEFIGARHPALGDFLACSLFSPMFEFVDHAAAHATAVAAMAALFDAESREPDVHADALTPAPAAAPPAQLSKRDFLFGHLPRAGRGP